MADDRVMVLGEKESFLIRILVKKLQEAGMSAGFVNWSIDSINAAWDGTGLVTIFMDEDSEPPRDTMHFLVEKAVEQDKLLIPIGEQRNVQYIIDRVPGNLIYKSFIRPIDNDEYVRTVREVLDKVSAGELRKSILIVDDDPSYMGLVREWLKETYKISMANSGLQAIKWLGKNKADLILLDYEMPVTTGAQVLEMLRNDEDTKDIPVIFLTGKDDKKSVMAVMGLKPQGYFLKNIQKDELLTKLREYFVLNP